MNIFGTSGIRGILGKTHSINDIIKIVYSIFQHFRYKPLIIGWDCRKHSYPLAKIAVSLGLLYGIDVATSGIVSTPAFQKYLTNRSGRYGIMFTASHNPPEYFGIKVFREDGVEIYEEDEKSITSIFYSINDDYMDIPNYLKANVKETDITPEVLENYLERIDETFKITDTFEKYIVGVDYGSCAAIKTVKPYLTRKKFREIIEVNSIIDGNFINRSPEPTPISIRNTLELVKNRIDIGVAFDGDADRGMIFDGTGNVYWGDEVSLMILTELKDELGVEAVVTPVSTSTLITKQLTDYGIKVVLTKVGAKNIVKTMLKKNYLFGFEENGGLIYLPHIPGRDGLATFILTLKTLRKTRSSLKKLREKHPRSYIIKDKIQVKSDKIHLMRQLKEIILNEFIGDAMEIIEIDGIKVITKEYSILVRPSGTEPVIRVFYEYYKNDDLSVYNKIVNLIKEIDKTLTYI